MKGLILKDWYVIAKTCRLQLGIILLMSALSLIRGLSMTYISYAMLFAGMLAIYTLSVDDKWGWNAYVQTLPYTRRAVVTAKYLVALISLALTAALNYILWAVGSAIAGQGIGVGPDMLALALAMGLFFPAVTLPFMFRFGSERGRFLMLVVVGLMVGALVGVMMVFSNEDGGDQPALAAAAGNVAPLVLLAAVVLFILSWLLAMRLYEKREL